MISKNNRSRDRDPEEFGFRSRQRNEELRFALARSSLGLVLVAASAKGIVSISLGEEQSRLIEILQEEFPMAHLIRENGTLDDLLPGVIEFIEKPVGDFTWPLDMRGTDFQKSVWRAVQKIPAGETRTYGEIAAAIGAPKAIRAVGSSCTKCKLAMVVPCHRVTSKGEAAGQDTHGSERRRMLVEREAAMAPPKAAKAKLATKKKKP